MKLQWSLLLLSLVLSVHLRTIADCGFAAMNQYLWICLGTSKSHWQWDTLVPDNVQAVVGCWWLLYEPQYLTTINHRLNHHSRFQSIHWPQFNDFKPLSAIIKQHMSRAIRNHGYQPKLTIIITHPEPSETTILNHQKHPSIILEPPKTLVSVTSRAVSGSERSGGTVTWRMQRLLRQGWLWWLKLVDAIY